jgi:hypothetical protein
VKQRRRPLGRIVIRAGILLLLGAIVNVAVAWGLAACSPLLIKTVWKAEFRKLQTQQRDGSWRLEKDGWEAVASGIWPYEFPTPTLVVRSIGPGVRVIDVAALVEGNSLPWELTEWRSGWPMHALSGHAAGHPRLSYAWQPNRYVKYDEHLWEVPLPSQSKMNQDCKLPLRPLWPGFALNTLLYAVILWLLFAAPFALRRWRRVRRGECPACAYPVGTSAVCTECGGPVRPGAAERASP